MVAMAHSQTAPPEGSADLAWRDEQLTDPHGAADKAQRVRNMFAAIAGSYDLNNRVHSLWRDQAWRRKTVRLCNVQPTDVVLDVACGTGDLAMAFADAGPKRVIGLDFTHEMLRVAQGKGSQTSNRKSQISYADGDAMNLPVADASVDVVSIAFGIRNVAHPAKALAEFARVLRPGGRLAILEFSLPRNPLLLAGYNFYFKQVLPRTATMIARDRTGAYKYLPQSVNTFIDREQMVDLIRQAGLTSPGVHPLTFGIAVCYVAHQPE